MSTSNPSARRPIASASAMLASSSTTNTRMPPGCHGGRSRVPDGSAAVAASMVHGGAAGTDVVDASVLGGVVVVVRFASPEPFALLDDEQPATSASPPISTIGTIARARRDGTGFVDIGAPA